MQYRGAYIAARGRARDVAATALLVLFSMLVVAVAAIMAADVLRLHNSTLLDRFDGAELALVICIAFVAFVVLLGIASVFAGHHDKRKLNASYRRSAIESASQSAQIEPYQPMSAPMTNREILAEALMARQAEALSLSHAPRFRVIRPNVDFLDEDAAATVSGGRGMER